MVVQSFTIRLNSCVKVEDKINKAEEAKKMTYFLIPYLKSRMKINEIKSLTITWVTKEKQYVTNKYINGKLPLFLL